MVVSPSSKWVPSEVFTPPTHQAHQFFGMGRVRSWTEVGHSYSFRGVPGHYAYGGNIRSSTVPPSWSLEIAASCRRGNMSSTSSNETTEAVGTSSSAFADEYTKTPIDDMYARTPFDVTCIESYEMDSLLACLVTPAHHALYIIHHAFQTCGNFAQGLSHCFNLLKPNCCFIYSESPRSGIRKNLNIHGIDDDLIRPGVHFNVVRNEEAKMVPVGWSVVKDYITTKKLMTTINQRTASADLKRHLESLHRHLYINLGSDIRDKAADVALALSMVPIANVFESTCVNRIMEILCHVASKEIARRRNQSRKSVELLSMCEKFAAAGCSGGCLQLVISEARKVSEGLNGSDSMSQTMANNLANLNFWSERSLLALWRKSHTLHKVSKRDFDSALSVEDIIVDPPKFDDPSLPLVVDVGCGLGVTLIGLAAMAEGQLSDERSESDRLPLPLEWAEYNYLGADYSLNATRWASSLTMRMKLSGRCHFIHASAEALLEYADKADVNVKMILVQFPTPYRLNHDDKQGGRNEKLPRSSVDPTFLANETFLDHCAEILTRDEVDSERYILLQSNCEDVALQLHESLLSRNLVAMDAVRPRHTFNGLEVSSRTKSWLQSRDGEHTYRALGRQWSSEPIIPVATETEASCSKHATPIHRCLFKVSL